MDIHVLDRGSIQADLNAAVDGSVVATRSDPTPDLRYAEFAVWNLLIDHPEATVEVNAPRRLLAPVDPEVDLAVGQLVENAIEHDDSAAPAVRLSLTDEGDAVRLRVTGGAPGVPADEQAVLAGDRPIDQLNHTSGLGLWLVKWVVDRTGGDLAFEDGGRTVVVTLPRPAGSDGGRISEVTD